MPKIYIQGRIVETPLLQAGSAITLSVCIDTPANVTVSFSSERGLFTVTASLTFTTLNYNVFQNLTVTPVNSGAWTGAADFIIATATGFTSVRKKIYVTYTDQGKFFRNFNWPANIHINSQSDITTLTDYVKNFNHNNSYPTGATPDATTSSYTGNMHGVATSAITGFSSVTKLDWNYTDINGETWTHSTFYITASSPKSPREIIMLHDGHEPNPATCFDQALARGYDIMLTSMPVCGPTHIAAAHSSLVTLTQTAGHKQLLSAGIDRAGYNAIEIFMFDKVKALNYIENTGLYGSRIYQYGYSGAAIAIMFLAIDGRVKKSYLHRGIVPREWMQSPNPLTTHGDYESVGDADGTSTFCGPRRYAFGTAFSVWDLLIIGNSGGKKLVISSNYGDTEGTGATWNDITFEKIEDMVSQYGGTLTRIMFNNSAQAAHAFYSDEITTILNDLEL